MTSPQTGLVRAIGRWSLAALAVNSIIGSGIYGLPATVAGLLGKRSVIAVVIAGAAMGVIMACFAEVASQFSEAGGPYLYARTAFGRLTGILVGWMLYLAQTAAPAANANLFVIYLTKFWPAAKEPWPRFVILTLLVGVLGPGATTDRPLAEVARITMGNRGAGLVAIGALVSVYGYLSAKLLGMPRVTFALARGGDLPALFGAVGPRFHTPWFSILFFAAVVWGLALVGSFAWNVTLSVVARLFYYAVICAALIALRRKQPLATAFRLPGGPVLAVLGVGIAVALATQVDLSKSLILAATVGAAFVNWLWVRRARVSE